MSRNQSNFSPAQRTVQIWSLLSLAAHTRQTLTEKMVANLAGFEIKDSGHVSYITDHCAAYGLPCLARLVVSEKTGKPSEDLPGKNEDVFDYDWIGHKTPIKKEKLSLSQRTVQIWILLSLAARNRQALTYGMVADTVGRVIPQGLPIYLNKIKDYCAARDLPCLARLVINKKSGDPGKDLADTNEDVFLFDWINYPTPSPQDFE
jgi:hypothetical protein